AADDTVAGKVASTASIHDGAATDGRAAAHGSAPTEARTSAHRSAAAERTTTSAEASAATASAAAMATHLHLLEHRSAIERRVRPDRRRASGTDPESTDCHHSGGQKHRASCHCPTPSLIPISSCHAQRNKASAATPPPSTKGDGHAFRSSTTCA